jgi:DNA-binding MurR/RpiR family transcriptional regulator
MREDDPTIAAQAPRTVEAFRARLASVTPALPRRLRQCAGHVALNLDRIAVSTVAELSAGAGVSPSAFMRFCQIMGFAGFSDMQRMFRAAFSPGLPDYATRLRNLAAKGTGSPAALLAEFVEAGRAALDALARDAGHLPLDAATTVLADAALIHVAGVRRAFPAASYLAYVLDKMDVPAVLHDGVGGLGQPRALRPGDALVAISFAPYAAETRALADRAFAVGVPVVALTDRLDSPLAEKAKVILTVEEVDFGAFRSLSATIALALSLAVAVGAARRIGASQGDENGIKIP